MFLENISTQIPDTAEECSKQIEKLDEEHMDFSKKHSKYIYICQAFALFSFALAIPEAMMKGESTFLTILVAGVLFLLWPFVHTCGEREYWKQKSLLEKKMEDLKKGENKDA